MFPDIDIDTIKDVWRQCGKNSAALTEMLLQLANPEMANDDDIQNANEMANRAVENQAAARMARQQQMASNNEELMLQQLAGM